MTMLDRCDDLRRRIEVACGEEQSGRWFDALGHYRLWWDAQGIESETDDGWPMEFCFEQENVEAFACYWKGEEANDAHQLG